MERLVRESRECFLEEAESEQFIGGRFADAAGLKIEFLLGIDAR